MRSFDAAEGVQGVAGPTAPPTGVRALFGIGSDLKRLPSKENLIWASVGGGLALAVHPADDNVNEYLVGNTKAEKFFKPGAVIGQIGTLLSTSLVIYAVGRIGDKPKVSHVGMDLIQALIVAEAIVSEIRERARPDGMATSFIRPRGRHVCVRHRARASSRLEVRDPRVPLRFVRRHLAVARESPLAERCGIWFDGRHYRRPHGNRK
jgi:hypothetical protein